MLQNGHHQRRRTHAWEPTAAALREPGVCHYRGVRDIRAVVTDLDGTIVDAKKRVSTATVLAAADLAERGIPLILATARTPSWVAAMTALISSVRVAVCCGGAVGWAPATGEMLWRDTIRPEDVGRIVEFTRQCLPEAGLAVYDGWQWRVTEEYAANGPRRPGPTQIVAAERITDYPICTVSIYHPSGRWDGLLVEMESPLIVESSADVTDIAPAGADKARGVVRALAAVDVDPAYAIAFGDMPMDLPMFAVCGYSVAVGNAHPDVVSAATAVAACVHCDGFARSLSDLGLARVHSANGANDCGCPQIDAARRPAR